MAFLPLPSLRPIPRRRPTRTTRCTLSPLPLDPLPAFAAFCSRTKTTLRNEAAQADGLASFTTPFTYPATHAPPHTRAIGRRFHALIDDFRSPPHTSQSAGLVLKLVPHDPLLPCLRADVHYFQTDAAWWFSGGCDLSAGPAGGLGMYGERFLRVWQTLRERYRGSANVRSSFLDICYGGAVDRETAFSFVSDVVDGVLPAYLPLLLESTPRRGGDGEPESESVEEFCIVGGAACESSTLRREPFVSWRFSLAPSALTAAGRNYDNLREAAETACLL